MASLASLARAYRLRSAFEVRLLRASIFATLAIACVGILLGLLADSVAIIFDGLFSLIDAAITMLMLAVARLVSSEGSRRFQYGFWHLEPLVLGFKASVLLLLIGYAFVNAVQQLLSGGNEPQLGIAVVYAALVTVLCGGRPSSPATASNDSPATFRRRGARSSSRSACWCRCPIRRTPSLTSTRCAPRSATRSATADRSAG